MRIRVSTTLAVMVLSALPARADVLVPPQFVTCVAIANTGAFDQFVFFVYPRRTPQRIRPTPDGPVVTGGDVLDPRVKNSEPLCYEGAPPEVYAIRRTRFQQQDFERLLSAPGNVEAFDRFFASAGMARAAARLEQFKGPVTWQGGNAYQFQRPPRLTDVLAVVAVDDGQLAVRKQSVIYQRSDGTTHEVPYTDQGTRPLPSGRAPGGALASLGMSAAGIGLCAILLFRRARSTPAAVPPRESTRGPR